MTSEVPFLETGPDYSGPISETNDFESLNSDSVQRNHERRRSGQQIFFRWIAMGLVGALALFLLALASFTAFSVLKEPDKFKSLAITIPLLSVPILAATGLVAGFVAAAFGREKIQSDEKLNKLTDLVTEIAKGR